MPSLRQPQSIYGFLRSLIVVLSQQMSRFERRLFIGFSLVSLLAIGGISQERWLAASIAIPSSGGVYREGILTTATVRPSDNLTESLTHLGLLQLAADGSLQAGVASDWTVSDDGQTFRLTINNRWPAEGILEVIKAQTSPGYWNNAAITHPEGQILEFHLIKPWAGFLTELSTPIFPYGPYRVSSHEENIYKLAANPEALTVPLIPRIELQLFTDERTLERAMRKGSIDSVYLPYASPFHPIESWGTYQKTLRLEHLLIFNLRQSALEDQAVRDRLVRGEAVGGSLRLHLVTTDGALMQDFANQVQGEWAKLGVEVVIEAYPILTLTKKILPERAYDVALLGIDYGPDGDLYPYWHSSQIAAPGQNIAGYRNKTVDQLLDETRQLKDQAARYERFQRARAILKQDAVMIQFAGPVVTYLRSPLIHGDVPETFAHGDSRWLTISSWYTKEKRIPKTDPST